MHALQRVRHRTLDTVVSGRATCPARMPCLVRVAAMAALMTHFAAGAAHADGASPHRVYLPSLVRAEPTSAGCRIALQESFENEVWQADGGDVTLVNGVAFAGEHALQLKVNTGASAGLVVRSPRFPWAAGRTVTAVHASAAWRGYAWQPIDALFGDHLQVSVFGTTPQPYMSFVYVDSFAANRGWAVSELHVTDPRELAFAQFPTAEVRIDVSEDSVERTTWLLDDVTVTVCTE